MPRDPGSTSQPRKAGLNILLQPAADKILRIYSWLVQTRLKTIVSLAGLEEAAARAAVPDLLERLGREPRVLGASATWEAADTRLLVTIESESEGPVSDADEADNFHRVWRCAVACIADEDGRLRFDLDGSI